MPYRSVDLRGVRTYPLPQRSSRVSLEHLVYPGDPVPAFDSSDLLEVARAVASARQAGRPVICNIGAHVVKRGLSPLLIDLMERGVVTHLSSNGAAAIHDFEIALQGGTSEDVQSALENGMFGMAEETGSLMNQAIRAGARDGLGMGEALGRMIAGEDARFPYRQYSLLYAAYRLHIPYTVHVALGTDIIHQHPAVDFAATGWASGQDFKIFTASVCDLEGGVFCNFGSAVLGPEVFLKAFSIARNLGHPLRVLTTANFDLYPLGDYRSPVGDDALEYARARTSSTGPWRWGARAITSVGITAIRCPTCTPACWSTSRERRSSRPGQIEEQRKKIPSAGWSENIPWLLLSYVPRWNAFRIWPPARRTWRVLLKS
jgi:hypothetical protein